VYHVVQRKSTLLDGLAAPILLQKFTRMNWGVLSSPPRR
jgi:hypothetical protein